MSQEIFSDGFASVTVTGAIVRIDLMVFAGQGDDGKPRFEVRQRLVMPLDGFLRSFALSQDTVNKLKKAGVLKSRPAEAAGPTVQVTSKGGPGSPNFS